MKLTYDHLNKHFNLKVNSGLLETWSLKSNLDTIIYVEIPLCYLEGHLVVTVDEGENFKYIKTFEQLVKYYNLDVIE